MLTLNYVTKTVYTLNKWILELEESTKNAWKGVPQWCPRPTLLTDHVSFTHGIPTITPCNKDSCHTCPSHSAESIFTISPLLSSHSQYTESLPGQGWA